MGFTKMKGADGSLITVNNDYLDKYKQMGYSADLKAPLDYNKLPENSVYRVENKSLVGNARVPEETFINHPSQTSTRTSTASASTNALTAKPTPTATTPTPTAATTKLTDAQKAAIVNAGLTGSLAGKSWDNLTQNEISGLLSKLPTASSKPSATTTAPTTGGLTATQQAEIKRLSDAYAQARANGDSAGMKAANDAANAIRASAGVGQQYANVDIGNVQGNTQGNNTTPTMPTAQTGNNAQAQNIQDLINSLIESMKQPIDIPKGLSMKDASKQASAQLSPMYENAKIQALESLKNDQISRGFYGQLPGETQKFGKSVELENDKIGAISQLANSLVGQSQNQAMQIAQFEAAQRQNQLSNALALQNQQWQGEDRAIENARNNYIWNWQVEDRELAKTQGAEDREYEKSIRAITLEMKQLESEIANNKDYGAVATAKAEYAKLQAELEKAKNWRATISSGSSSAPKTAKLDSVVSLAIDALYSSPQKSYKELQNPNSDLRRRLLVDLQDAGHKDPLGFIHDTIMDLWVWLGQPGDPPTWDASDYMNGESYEELIETLKGSKG